MNTQEFVQLGAGEHQLGWRFTDSLDPRVREAIEPVATLDEFLSNFSGPRAVRLEAFEIATSAELSVQDLLGDVYELEVDTVEDVCDACDAALRDQSLRLPTEDELEAALGGELFPWGEHLPDGDPYSGSTSFNGHRDRTPRGLALQLDTYRVELTREAFKLGDGGKAVCGGEPWPIAWFSLCPSFRVARDEAEELLFELLETTHIRPVRL